MRNFRELDIWKNSVALALDIYSLTDSFPKEEKYGLISQIRRCAVSIPSNIAEGCSGTNKSLINYLSIALGSSFELETQLIIANRLNLFSEKSKEFFEKISLLQKQINAFRNSIKQ
jgi:four helix bundle protein